MDYLSDALPVFTANGDGAVRLRMGSSGIAAVPPRSVMEVVEETCNKVPNHRALAFESASGWSYITYKARVLLPGRSNGAGVSQQYIYCCARLHPSGLEAASGCLSAWVQFRRVADRQLRRHLCWVSMLSR
jgi:hypothetical protein